MTKLNKANNDGTVSITIPKGVAKEMGWEPGQLIGLTKLDSCNLLVINKTSIRNRDGGDPLKYDRISNLLDTLSDLANHCQTHYTELKNGRKGVEQLPPSWYLPEESFIGFYSDVIKSSLANILDRLP